jgi:hypothetical protein
MKKLLVEVDYTDSTNKFYFDSYIKNRVISVDLEKETIHQIIKNLCEEEGMELSYKGKPQGNVFCDSKDGETRTIGYIYRGKTEIGNQKALFDVWVSIYEVIDFTFETI